MTKLLLIRNDPIETENANMGGMYIAVKRAPTFICDTLENPYKDNKRSISCIPAGEYPLLKRKTGKYYRAYNKRWGHEYVWEIINVPNRKYILIHCGNFVKDTRGCPLIGDYVEDGYIKGSRDRYQEFYNVTYEHDPVSIVVL